MLFWSKCFDILYLTCKINLLQLDALTGHFKYCDEAILCRSANDERDCKHFTSPAVNISTIPRQPHALIISQILYIFPVSSKEPRQPPALLDPSLLNNLQPSADCSGSSPLVEVNAFWGKTHSAQLVSPSSVALCELNTANA